MNLQTRQCGLNSRSAWQMEPLCRLQVVLATHKDKATFSEGNRIWEFGDMMQAWILLQFAEWETDEERIIFFYSVSRVMLLWALCISLCLWRLTPMSYMGLLREKMSLPQFTDIFTTQTLLSWNPWRFCGLLRYLLFLPSPDEKSAVVKDMSFPWRLSQQEWGISMEEPYMC